MRRRRKVAFDPVASWDGLISTPVGLWTADEMQRNAQHTLRVMERHPKAIREDDEAKATPIGGMQFKSSYG